MSWTDNPVRDFEAYDAQQQREQDRLPICSDCGNPIQTDKLFLINDEFICPECLIDNYRKDTADYVE